MKRLKLWSARCSYLESLCTRPHRSRAPLRNSRFTNRRAGKQSSPRKKERSAWFQFLFTWCQHCQATPAQWLSKMQSELGPKGLQVYGVAFNDEVLTKDAPTNNKLTSEFSHYAAFPVGLVKAKEPVLRFLGLSPSSEGYGVPQMVVIDKKGVIRAQTPARPGKGSIVEESVMRDLVNKLLLEK